MLPRGSFNPRSHTGSDIQDGHHYQLAAGSNPRPHTGSDGRQVRGHPEEVRVSIHAPTRGATLAKGGTFKAIVFQSTLPHGERPTKHTERYPWKSSFNPRSHTGSDEVYMQTKVDYLLFQSTLPHGERQMQHGRHGNTAYVSIHAPTRGATFAFNLSDF